MASRDPYKRLSKEWGSKSKKEDSRRTKASLKKIEPEEYEEEYVFRRMPAATVQWAIDSYETITPIGVLRLAGALQEAYAELDRLKEEK
jgi:hypothetical protein